MLLIIIHVIVQKVKISLYLGKKVNPYQISCIACDIDYCVYCQVAEVCAKCNKGFEYPDDGSCLCDLEQGKIINPNNN